MDQVEQLWLELKVDIAVPRIRSSAVIEVRTMDEVTDKQDYSVNLSNS
jgi:hypothetical protein